MPDASVLVIPWRELSEDALRSLIESCINREGTDYGEREYTLEEKVSQVEKQLASGDLVVVYDTEDKSCSLLAKDGQPHP